MVLAVAAASVQHSWRLLTLITATPLIIYLLCDGCYTAGAKRCSTWQLIPESPRWLLSQRRVTEAQAVLEVMLAGHNTQLECLAARGPR